MRNGQLRQLCGFDLFKGIKAGPSANAYTNFLKLLVRHTDLIDAIFYDLVEKLDFKLHRVVWGQSANHCKLYEY
jgi:hypothetical protein